MTDKTSIQIQMKMETQKRQSLSRRNGRRENVRMRKENLKSLSKAVAHVQTVDILNAMDTKERKKILKYFGSSTVEMCMQSTKCVCFIVTQT